MPLALFSFLRIVVFGYLWSFLVPYELQNCFFPISIKSVFGILIVIAINVYIAWGPKDILTIHEHGMSVYLHILLYTNKE